jgi:hypothetical protein
LKYYTMSHFQKLTRCQFNFAYLGELRLMNLSTI